MTDTEFEAFLADDSKQIVGDLGWAEDEDHSPALEFRAEVRSAVGWPVFVRGSFNPLAGALSYTLVHRGSGRVYGLDLGKDHHNPSCQNTGEKHKHRWSETMRDKEAYVPGDITAPVTEPCAVWEQFCLEARIDHQGKLNQPPPIQESFL